MTKIYIVMGSTGEYSDHKEWGLKAFKDETKAKTLVTLAASRAREIYNNYKNYYDIPDGLNEYDPSMQTDYTGVLYSYIEMELEE